MEFFDAHLDITAWNQDDLRHLHFFGGRGALVSLAHPRRPYETTRAALAATQRMIEATVQDFEVARLDARVLVSIPWSSRPQRWHGDLWSGLLRLLSHPGVAAVGPVTAPALVESAEHARQHLLIARELDLPVLLLPSRERFWDSTQELLALSREVGVPGQRLMVARTNYTTLRSVLDAGALACVATGPDHLKSQDTADFIERFGPDAWSSMALSTSAAGGSLDILAIPKTLRELEKLQLPTAAIKAIARGNLVRWLHRHALV
jgi:predicted metal-dependent TIM-barrel fold hydrolase